VKKAGAFDSRFAIPERPPAAPTRHLSHVTPFVIFDSTKINIKDT
jgi:hypothetical protein